MKKCPWSHFSLSSSLPCWPPPPIWVSSLLRSTPLFLVNSAQVGSEVGGNSEGTSISRYLGLPNGTWTHIGTGPQAHSEGGGLVLGPSCDGRRVLSLSSSEIFSPHLFHLLCRSWSFLMSVTLSNHLLLSEPLFSLLKSQGELGRGPLGSSLPGVILGPPWWGQTWTCLSFLCSGPPFCSVTFCDDFSTSSKTKQLKKPHKHPIPFLAFEYHWVTPRLFNISLWHSECRPLVGCILFVLGNRVCSLEVEILQTADSPSLVDSG